MIDIPISVCLSIYLFAYLRNLSVCTSVCACVNWPMARVNVYAFVVVCKP